MLGSRFQGLFPWKAGDAEFSGGDAVDEFEGLAEVTRVVITAHRR